MPIEIILDVHLRIRPELLDTVLRVLDGSCEVVSVNSSEAERDRARRKKSVYRGGVKNKGVSGEELVLRTVSEAKTTVYARTVRDAFRARQFADTSHSASLSKSIQDGLVGMKMAGGLKTYSLTGKGAARLDALKRMRLSAPQEAQP